MNPPNFLVCKKFSSAVYSCQCLGHPSHQKNLSVVIIFLSAESMGFSNFTIYCNQSCFGNYIQLANTLFTFMRSFQLKHHAVILPLIKSAHFYTVNRCKQCKGSFYSFFIVKHFCTCKNPLSFYIAFCLITILYDFTTFKTIF